MSTNSASSPTVNGEAIEPEDAIGVGVPLEQDREGQPTSPQTAKRQREVASDTSPDRDTSGGIQDDEPASKKARVADYDDAKETGVQSHDALAQNESREEGEGSPDDSRHGRNRDDRSSRASPHSRERSRDRDRLAGEERDHKERRDPWDQRDRAYDRQRPSATGPDARDLPSRRKVDVSQEERKRGQRLFGGMLSTLGQPSSRLAPHGRRRAEQQQQQQQRQRQQEERQEQKEDKKLQAERLAELTKTRQIQQVQFDERTMDARHANMLSLAHSLQTKSEPKLYYLPWELSREQQEIVDDQIRTAEERIERERDEFAHQKQERLAALGVVASTATEAAKTDGPAATQEEPSGEQPAQAPPEEEGKQVQPHATETETEGPEHRDDHRHRHDHDEKDIMVETEEDTVLY